MSTPENENGSISHRGPVSGVTVHAHMRSGPHSLMEYPLDLTLATELMFLFAEQARRSTSTEPLVITPRSVLEHLQSIGVRSGNGSRTVGRDAVYESFARLRGKGYIRRTFGADPETGQRTGVAYEFYDWPAWNPDAPAITETPTDGTSTQVGATSGNAGSGDAGSRTRKRTKSRSPQVGATSGNAGSGDAGSRSKQQVGATSGIAGSPPLPPGGGTTPPPNPLMHTDGAQEHPSQTEEEGVFDEKDIAAAAAFLQQLPAPWIVGEKDALEMASQLLKQMHRKQWPSIHTVNRDQLVACLTGNPGGVKTSHAIVLRTHRIPNLRPPAKSAASNARSSAAGRELCPNHPSRYRVGCIDCAMAVPA